MTDVFGAAPSRKLSKASSGYTRPATGKIIFVSNAALFAQRGKKMEVKKEFSQGILDQLVAKYPSDTFIVCTDGSYSVFDEYLENAKSRIDLRTFKISENSLGETTTRLIALLKGLGVRFKRIRNPRSVHYRTIYKFIDDDNFLYVEASDYDLLGISPDKELTFNDMAKKRERASWP